MKMPPSCVIGCENVPSIVLSHLFECMQRNPAVPVSSRPRPAAPPPPSRASPASTEDESEERFDLLPYVSLASIGSKKSSHRRPLKAVPHSLSGSVVRSDEYE